MKHRVLHQFRGQVTEEATRDQGDDQCRIVSLRRTNRHSACLAFYFIHVRLNMTSWDDVSLNLGTEINTEGYLLPIRLLNQQLRASHVQDFARDDMETFLGFVSAFRGVGLLAWDLGTGVIFSILIRLRAIGEA
ncbi:MAG: hypothetical protein ACREJN_04670 [Nitrospiraceae bacterium]